MKPVAEMSEQEKAQVRAWIRNWQELGPILEEMRWASLSHVDTAAAIEAFDLAYKSARLRCPQRVTSGLVEQQRWFKQLHR
ncbi:MAG: hypothetical protein HY674_21425 [Chloroflexi bacterium]|nr:hypothetical protein [Chloroflexota bacterium]